MENFSLTKQKIVLLASAGLGLISVFLPWGSISSGSFYGYGFSSSYGGFGIVFGIFAFLTYGAIIAACFLDAMVPPIKDYFKYIVMGGGGFCVLMSFLALIAPHTGWSMGWGVFVSLVAGGAILASAFVDIDALMGGGPKE